MSTPGADDLMVRSRSALLDALEALGEHRDSVIVVGAQAVYLHTGSAQVALAEATKDADLALDPRTLGNDPLIEAAMRSAGFHPDPDKRQPGAWISDKGMPVDLMVPEALTSGGRGARIPPHNPKATRRAAGLEAAVVDNLHMEIRALAPTDTRVITARVAGPAALLVAKLHKIKERVGTSRLADKDAHDIYRLLVAVETQPLAQGFQSLLHDPVSAAVTTNAVQYMHELFAAGPAALGCVMAGRAESGIGDPEAVAVACAFLAEDLIRVIPR